MAGLAAHALLVALAEPLARGGAVGEHGVLGDRRARLGVLERALEMPPASDDLCDEPDPVCLLGLDDAPGQDHVQRPAEANDARQALSAAVDERHAEAALCEAQLGVIGGDAQVTPEGQLEPAGKTPTGDGGDGGLGRDQPREAERPVLEGHARLEALDRLQVGSGAEGELAGAGQDEHAGLVVVDEPAVGLGEQAGGGPVDGVAALWAVDRQDGRGAAALVGDWVGHRSKLLRPFTSSRAAGARMGGADPLLAGSGPVPTGSRPFWAGSLEPRYQPTRLRSSVALRSSLRFSRRP